MSAQPWALYNRAKFAIGNSTLNLAATVYRITLHQSASNFATKALINYVSLTSEVASVANNSYSTSGKALTGEVWTTGSASAGVIKFDCNDPVWTASTAPIVNIKGAVIWLSAASALGRHLLVRASLTSTQFTLGTGNTLTLQMNASGVFTMA